MIDNLHRTEALCLLEAAIRLVCVQYAVAKKGYLRFGECLIKYGFGVKRDAAILPSDCMGKLA
jgi:hypothetical protein